MANGDERPVVPSTQLADAIGFGFQTIIDGLRTDMREDFHEAKVELGKVEERVTARVNVLDGKITAAGVDWHTFTVEHGKDHEDEAEERRTSHGQFYEFIRAAELDKARRDGALGVVRYSIELLSKHAGRIIGILATLGLLGGLATGNIHLGIGR